MSKYSQFPKVNCQYGAPMGRATWNDDLTEKCRCFKVNLDSGGYDRGGSYWGTPNNLYCATNGEGFREFTRSDSCKNAKIFFKKWFPGIKWVN